MDVGILTKSPTGSTRGALENLSGVGIVVLMLRYDGRENGEFKVPS